MEEHEQGGREEQVGQNEAPAKHGVPREPGRAFRPRRDNVEIWLRILSIIMTAFVAIAGGLGAFSVFSIFGLQGQLREERTRAQEAANKTTAAYQEVLALGSEVRERASQVDQEVDDAVAGLWARVEEELQEMRSAIDSEVGLVEDEVWDRVEAALDELRVLIENE